MAFKELVFSGVQPTGNLHLGNYLGAIKRFVELQDRYDCIYCVVDLHAITVWQDPIELPKAIREVTAAFIACGIDPKKHIVFNQSQVAEHAELAWVFNCVARLGWLNRMTQFKEKAGKDRENASVGLYAYPTLMAADILVYRATHVPVGEDQKQHLELSRDIAQKFNNDFGQSIKDKGFGDVFFPQPEPLITGEATRVMSLRDGTKKMSKSDASDQSRINLTDDADAIAQKVRRAKTDPEPLPSEEKGLETRPEADNLVGIYAALADTTRVKVLQQFGNAQFSTFKNALTELAVAKLNPINSEMKRLLNDPAAIDAVLADGSARARKLASKTMNAVKEIVGFVGPVSKASSNATVAETEPSARTVEEMGRLCIAWSFLESVSERALRGILGDEEYGRAKTSQLDMRRRWEMILEHAPKKYNDDELRQLREINQAIPTVIRDRNIIVHGQVHASMSVPTEIKLKPGTTLREGEAGKAFPFVRPPAWTIFRGSEAGKNFPISTEAVEIVRTNIQALGKKVSDFNSKQGYSETDGSNVMESDWPRPLE